MLKAGEGHSRHEDKQNHEDGKEKIYSYSTYTTYWKHSKYFFAWLKETHPECTTLKVAKPYVKEWLEYRAASIGPTGRPLSAWTLHAESSALSKLFGISKDDPNRFIPPERKRYDIVRSREIVESDRHFSKSNNAELISFCKATGCRRNVLEKLEGQDYWSREKMVNEVRRLESLPALSSKELTLKSDLKAALSTFPDQTDFLHHRRDKGGKSRFGPILGQYKNIAIERLKETESKKKVFEHISKNADVHSYRASYARSMYKHYARPINQIPYDRINRGSGHRYQSQVYHCRNDEKGRKLDKLAMKKTSQALGHNRISIIAESYLHGL